MCMLVLMGGKYYLLDQCVKVTYACNMKTIFAIDSVGHIKNAWTYVYTHDIKEYSLN